MAVIKLPNNWQPRPYQRPFWDYLEKGGKRAIEVAHRRWGKDDVLLHRACVAAFERPATYWHALPQYSQARKAIWNAVNSHTGKRRIDEAFPKELRDSTNDNEMFIRFKNGSTWQVIGSDRYDGLVGAGVAGVAFSEWALCNPSSWGYIRPMMQENNGWAAFITTPRGKNHAHSMYQMAKDNPAWFAQVSSVHSTGALSPEDLEESLAEYTALYGADLGQSMMAQEYECSFNAAIMGAYFAREMLQVRQEGRIDPTLEAIDAPVHTAWDLGVRDDTSIWFFQVVAGQIFILDCYTQSGAGVDHYAAMIEERRALHGWQPGIDFVPHDARVKEWGSGRTRVETMQALGLNPHVVPMATFMDGIQAVRKTLPRCVFHARCDDVGIAALEQYRREWDDERKTFKATDVHDWAAHPSAAFRYLSLAWRTIRPEPVKVEVPNTWSAMFKDRSTGGRIKV